MNERPGIEQKITWIYTEDLDRTAAFYGDAIGLELIRDEGTARSSSTVGAATPARTSGSRLAASSHDRDESAAAACSAVFVPEPARRSLMRTR